MFSFCFPLFSRAHTNFFFQKHILFDTFSPTFQSKTPKDAVGNEINYMTLFSAFSKRCIFETFETVFENVLVVLEWKHSRPQSLRFFWSRVALVMQMVCVYIRKHISVVGALGCLGRSAISFGHHGIFYRRNNRKCCLSL